MKVTAPYLQYSILPFLGGLGETLTAAIYAGAAVVVAVLIILPTIIISFIYKKNTRQSYRTTKGTISNVAATKKVLDLQMIMMKKGIC